MNLSASATPTHLIEPWAKRKARRAATRKIAIAAEAARLAETYSRLKLPVRPELIPEPDPIPAPVPFIPFRVKRREHKATGQPRRRASSRSHKATGRAIGRPPNEARAAAIKSGARTYRGRPCRHNHPEGIRYVIGSLCVLCQKAARDARTRAIRCAANAVRRPDSGGQANRSARVSGISRKRRIALGA